MNELTEFQQRATTAAVVKMLSGNHFSICDLDAIAKTLGCTDRLGGLDYRALHSMHCISWSDMGPDLARMTREKCLELLGLPPGVIEIVEPPLKTETPKEPARRTGVLSLFSRKG